MQGVSGDPSFHQSYLIILNLFVVKLKELLLMELSARKYLPALGILSMSAVSGKSHFKSLEEAGC